MPATPAALAHSGYAGLLCQTGNWHGAARCPRVRSLQAAAQGQELNQQELESSGKLPLSPSSARHVAGVAVMAEPEEELGCLWKAPGPQMERGAGRTGSQAAALRHGMLQPGSSHPQAAQHRAM